MKDSCSRAAKAASSCSCLLIAAAAACLLGQGLPLPPLCCCTLEPKSPFVGSTTWAAVCKDRRIVDARWNDPLLLMGLAPSRLFVFDVGNWRQGTGRNVLLTKPVGCCRFFTVGFPVASVNFFFSSSLLFCSLIRSAASLGNSSWIVFQRTVLIGQSVAQLPLKNTFKKWSLSYLCRRRYNLQCPCGKLQCSTKNKNFMNCDELGKCACIPKRLSAFWAAQTTLLKHRLQTTFAETAKASQIHVLRTRYMQILFWCNSPIRSNLNSTVCTTEWASLSVCTKLHCNILSSSMVM